MNDPRVLSIISLVFALLGAYNLYNGSRKMRDARQAGTPIRWYKQINVLTGIEYILLTFVFLLSLANQQGTINSSLRGLVLPLYFLLLLASAGIAGIVIRQGILNTRALRADKQSQAPTPELEVDPEHASSKREQEETAQRQRERRKKAAAARRRRAGKA